MTGGDSRFAGRAPSPRRSRAASARACRRSRVSTAQTVSGWGSMPDPPSRLGERAGLLPAPSAARSPRPPEPSMRAARLPRMGTIAHSHCLFRRRRGWALPRQCTGPRGPVGRPGHESASRARVPRLARSSRPGRILPWTVSGWKEQRMFSSAVLGGGGPSCRGVRPPGNRHQHVAGGRVVNGQSCPSAMPIPRRRAGSRCLGRPGLGSDKRDGPAVQGRPRRPPRCRPSSVPVAGARCDPRLPAAFERDPRRNGRLQP